MCIRDRNIIIPVSKLLSEKRSRPYISIREKLDRIIEELRQEKRNVREVYEDVLSLLEKLVSVEEEKKMLELSDAEYSLYEQVKRRGFNEGLLGELVELLKNLRAKQIPGWYLKSPIVKEIRRELKDFLLKYHKNLKEINSLVEEYIEGRRGE